MTHKDIAIIFDRQQEQWFCVLVEGEIDELGENLSYLSHVGQFEDELIYIPAEYLYFDTATDARETLGPFS